MGMPAGLAPSHRVTTAPCSCVGLARKIEGQPEVHSVTAVAERYAPPGSIVCAQGCGLAWYIIPTRLAGLVADALTAYDAR